MAAIDMRCYIELCSCMAVLTTVLLTFARLNEGCFCFCMLSKCSSLCNARFHYPEEDKYVPLLLALGVNAGALVRGATSVLQETTQALLSSFSAAPPLRSLAC